MTTLIRIAVMVSAHACLWTGDLAAQACDGYPPLREQPYRVGFTVADYSYARAMAASFTAGRSTYGTVGIGRTRDEGLVASTLDVAFEGGREVVVHSGLSVCPFVAFKATFGPVDFMLTETDHVYFDRQLGVAVGTTARLAQRLVVRPAASLTVARLTLTEKLSPQQIAAGVPARTRSDTYWLARLGLGLAASEAIAVRPAVTVPFGLVDPRDPDRFVAPFGREERELGFELTVAVSFGGRTRSAYRHRVPTGH